MLRTSFLRPGAFLWLLLFVAAATSMPALAHKDHKKKQEAAALAQAQANTTSASMTSPQAMHQGMSEMMTKDPDRSGMGFVGRLLDWLGRTHPVIVHFPIAFFPAALFTAVVGRRRPVPCRRRWDHRAHFRAAGLV